VEPASAAAALARTGIALNLIDDTAGGSGDRARAGSDNRSDRTADDGARRRSDSCAGRLLLRRASAGKKAKTHHENKLPHLRFLRARSGGPEKQLPSDD
jgi:hypothetical protein